MITISSKTIREHEFEKLKVGLLEYEKPSEFFRNEENISSWCPGFYITDDDWPPALEAIDRAANYRSYFDNPLYFMIAELLLSLTAAPGESISFANSLTDDKDLEHYLGTMIAACGTYLVMTNEGVDPKYDDLFGKIDINNALDLIYLIHCYTNKVSDIIKITNYLVRRKENE